MKRRKLPVRRAGVILLVMLSLLGIGGLALLTLSPQRVLANLVGEHPVSIRSALRANYGVDDRAFMIAPVEMRIVEEAIRDAVTPQANTNRYSPTRLVQLGTPPLPAGRLTPTVFQLPGGATLPPGVTVQATGTLSTPGLATPNLTTPSPGVSLFTATPILWSLSPTPVIFPSAIWSLTPTSGILLPTPTSGGILLPTPTSGWVASSTPVPPPATATLVPWTNTPRPPTNTPIPPPTNTPIPPNTPTTAAYPPPATAIPTVPYP